MGNNSYGPDRLQLKSVMGEFSLTHIKQIWYLGFKNQPVREMSSSTLNNTSPLG